MSYQPRLNLARFQPIMHPALNVEEEVPEEEKTQKLHEAGKIAADVRNHIAGKVKPGASVLDLCLEADEMIRKKNAVPAFPINISINDATAHYTAPPGDTLVIPDIGVVKVDVGAAIDGWIADTAQSVDLDGSYANLVKATIDSAEMAIKLIRPGTMTGDLGGLIEKTIRDAGFEPVRELSGHLVDRYVVHGGKTIPNVGDFKGDKVELGEVYAIETFASSGQGSVHADVNKITIFRASPVRVKIRSTAARKVLRMAIHDFGGMPFAERWLEKMEDISKSEIKIGMRELQRVGGLIEYHVLRTSDPTFITSQHEHTMIIREDGAEVTTKLE